MVGRFARLQERLHRACSDRLSDSIGTFTSPGCAPVEDVPLMVDRNIDLTGADDTFIGRGTVITFYVRDIASAARGDFFQIGCERFVVEQVASDDGHMITVLTQEAE